MDDSENIGLVFSGGGSRGSYQIGVWKALVEMNIADKITAVYGTSVGAINGAAFIQGDIQIALDIWQSLDYSKVFYGLVAFDLQKRKALYLTKEDIPDGQLVEYVIASATFPVFQPHKIEDRLYLDGGLVDNRPLGFFKHNKKVSKVIVVDVTMARHVWPNIEVKGDVDMYYVRPSRLLGSPLAFQTKRIISNLELGYQDARKQLARLRLGR